MKFKLFILSLAAAVLTRPPGFCTANAAADDKAALPAEFQKQLDDQAAQIADLQKQLDAKPAAAAAPEDTGTLAMLCKGAGVDIADVRWRVQAGVDPEQAVQAALSQKEYDAKVAADAKKKK